MKQPTITPADLYQYLPDTGKRLIEIIGQESAFTLMQKIGGKTHINNARRHGNFFNRCAGVLGEDEASRVIALLSSQGGTCTYIPSLKAAFAAREKDNLTKEVCAQYTANIKSGMGITAARAAIISRFGISDTKVRNMIKGVHHVQ
ncbi:hypothetical protein NFT50_004829 [Salmonella enterica]|nr:hypothetical protein [Salmonella enterica]EJH7016126.1 hypothetical protein [Salmonella enterica]EJH7437817.1 hypothetical protein [Salmonella enterica]EJH7877112.1 hypothetical protein [Salmonella enterica]EJH7880976.1 hypothetical protein [Salmonella enterica]